MYVYIYMYIHMYITSSDYSVMAEAMPTLWRRVQAPLWFHHLCAWSAWAEMLMGVAFWDDLYLSEYTYDAI